MNKNLVIIPTYNEEENIGNLVEKLLSLPEGYDVVVVDDGSDGTEALLMGMKESRPGLFLIKRKVKSGRGTAVLEGIKFGLSKGYEYLIEMDADFSHNPDELASLMKVADQNTVVIGSRYVPRSKILNWPLRRRIFSKCANFYADLVLRIGIKDYTDGYRVYGRLAAEKIDYDLVRSTGYIVLSEIAYQLFLKGVSFKEVPIIFVNRSRGSSSFSFKEITEALFSVIRLRRRYGAKK